MIYIIHDVNNTSTAALIEGEDNIDIQVLQDEWLTKIVFADLESEPGWKEKSSAMDAYLEKNGFKRDEDAEAFAAHLISTGKFKKMESKTHNYNW